MELKEEMISKFEAVKWIVEREIETVNCNYDLEDDDFLFHVDGQIGRYTRCFSALEFEMLPNQMLADNIIKNYLNYITFSLTHMEIYCAEIKRIANKDYEIIAIYTIKEDKVYFDLLKNDNIITIDFKKESIVKVSPEGFASLLKNFLKLS